MRPIYLDHHATTPCDPRVVEAMHPFLLEDFGNAASTSHVFGRRAREAVEHARSEVAALLGADPREIAFTSGATESLNIALKGLLVTRAPRKRVALSAVEHAVVRGCARYAARTGGGFDALAVDGEGRLDPETVRAHLETHAADTAWVAVMLANNEVGTIQPIEAISNICAEFEVPLVCDAVQGLGKVPLSVRQPGLVAVSASGHKIGGPKGIGALWTRSRPPLDLPPLFEGGAQERGLRPGTLPVSLIVGLGEACRILRTEGAEQARHMATLRDRLWGRLSEGLGDGVVRNGPTDGVLPNNLHVSFLGVESRALMAHLPQLAFSAGSACSSEHLQVSHVLTAMGLSPARIHTAARFGLGPASHGCDVDEAAEAVVRAVRLLQPGP